MSTTPPNPSPTKKWWQSNTYRGAAIVVLAAIANYLETKGLMPAELHGIVLQFFEYVGGAFGLSLAAVEVRGAVVGTGTGGGPIAKSLL